MMIGPIDMPQRGARDVTPSDLPRPAQMLFHAVMRADGGTGVARSGAQIVADATEGQGGEGADTSQDADITTSEAENRGKATGARQSWPISSNADIRQDATLLSDAGEASMRADQTAPEPLPSGQAARRFARSEAWIRQHFQSDTGQDPTPLPPLKPEMESPMLRDRSAAPEAGNADEAEAVRAQTISRPDFPDAQSDAEGSRLMKTGRSATALIENLVDMRQEVAARGVPDSAQHPGSERARDGAANPGAMQALPLTGAADQRHIAATDLHSPIRVRHGGTYGSAAIMTGPGAPEIQTVASGTPLAPAALLRPSQDIAAQDLTARHAAPIAGQISALADAPAEQSGAVGSQALRASGGAMTSVVPVAVGAVAHGQTGTRDVALMRDTPHPELPDGSTNTRLGRDAARLSELRPGSGLETTVLSGGTLPLAAYPPPVSGLQAAVLNPAARDGGDPAQGARSDRPDAGPLPAPGHAPPPLASQPLAQPVALAHEAGARSLRVQILEGVRRSGQSAFEIHLAPAELGRLRITLRPGETGMQLFFTADRPETLEMIRRHAGDLEQDLRALGYEALDLGFAQSDDRQTGSGQQQTGAAGAISDMPAPGHEIVPQASSGAANGGVDMRL